MDKEELKTNVIQEDSLRNTKNSIKKIMNKENLKKELIEEIIQQIIDDVENDDVEPIEEMISLIMSKSNMRYLIGYLSNVDSPVKYEDLLS